MARRLEESHRCPGETDRRLARIGSDTGADEVPMAGSAKKKRPTRERFEGGRPVGADKERPAIQTSCPLLPRVSATYVSPVLVLIVASASAWELGERLKPE
jgi:hypothetical protein